MNCVWKYDSNYDYYATGCDKAFSLIDGTPADNDLRFCPYCGGCLVIVNEEDADDKEGSDGQ